MKILIVIDMQNDFITGPLGTPEAVTIVDKIKEKINNKTYDDIYFTRDTHYDNYLNTKEGILLPVEHCLHESPGWCIVDELNKEAHKKDHIYDKNTFGYIDWRKHLPILYSTSTIEIVGVCTDICVISNALILRSVYPNINIQVDASCCAGTTPKMHEKALDVMKSCQIEVINYEN